MLQKIYILNKCCSFELSINQRIQKKASQFPQKYKAEQLFNIDNNQMFLEQQIIILE